MPSKITIRRQLLTLAVCAGVTGASLMPVFAQNGPPPLPTTPPAADQTPAPTAPPTARELARAAALDPVYKVTGSRSEVEIVERLSKVL